MTHDEVRLLLPWYAKATLPAGEREAVATHLAGCERCRAELASVSRLASAVGEAVERRPVPSRELFARVSAHVSAETGRAAEAQASWWARIERWAASLMMPRFAPALALGLIVVQLGAIAVLGARLAQPRGAGYVTQTGPESSQPVTWPRLRIAFDDRATEADIRAALRAAGATIVAGPTAAGFYVVAVTDATRALESLRRAAPVRLVEPLPR